MKKIVVIGSTGSVGLNTLDIVRHHPKEFSLVGLAANCNHAKLLDQVKEFNPEVVAMSDPEAAETLQSSLPDSVKCLSGKAGLSEIARWSNADLLIAASSGSSSLVPVLKAIEAGKQIGIANKEILVMAGRLIMDCAEKHDAPILPIDSEHNAIFQCMNGMKGSDIRKIILTGTGGPLKDVPSDKFAGLAPEVVIRHPKWSMGPKISVDSATMMNKGLEIIEATWLFGVTPEQIEVRIHPEAIVHSMVECVDGSVIAQMGPTDMRLPLIHVMAYPKRIQEKRLQLSIEEMNGLHFSPPDVKKFPCLQFAMEVSLKRDTTLPTVLNAADEIVVQSFLEKQIRFTDIPRIIEALLGKHKAIQTPTLEQILEVDRWTRSTASEMCGQEYQSIL